jgi:hypothetical protein
VEQLQMSVLYILEVIIWHLNLLNKNIPQHYERGWWWLYPICVESSTSSVHVFNPTNVHGWVAPALERLLLISSIEDIWKCIPLLFQTQMDFAQCPLSKNVATNRESNRSIKKWLRISWSTSERCHPGFWAVHIQKLVQRDQGDDPKHFIESTVHPL